VRKAVDGSCAVNVYSNELTITVHAQMLPGAVTGTTTICYDTDVPAFASTTPASGGNEVITYTWQYTTNMGAVPVMQTGQISADRIQQPTIRQI